MSTDPDLEAALAAAGLAGAAPGTTVPGPLVIAGPDDLPESVPAADYGTSRATPMAGGTQAGDPRERDAVVARAAIG